MEGNNLLSRKEHVFRKVLLCLTILFTSREDWAAEQDRNIPVGVIFADPSKAIDSVSRVEFKLNLEGFGIHDEVINWICVFLNDNK